MDAVDGRLEVTVPSRVRIEEGAHGPRLTTDGEASLTVAQVRDLTERGRR